ncbi:hypothetical protein CLPUN_17090 [Clostridium puniceum]|uniref:YjcQ protein n=1 Tax=Clostridium puniceum TaxID=29367 RepID=A0A1S8TN95_9CLOT|nr:hypothetical protein [Clostridium puniceum]OOM79119.1 hypothetical protein CLPUN_17090 [Clostridium puniceum]
MFKSNNEFEKAIYDILIEIRDSDSSKNILSKLGDINFDDAIEKAVQYGLISGLVFSKDASGRLEPSIIREIRLSHNGLKFIEDFKS